MSLVPKNTPGPRGVCPFGQPRHCRRRPGTERGNRHSLKMDDAPSHSGLSLRVVSLTLPTNQSTWSGKLTFGKPSARTSGQADAPPKAKL